MSTHTPGPWKSFKGNRRNGYLIITCPAECDNQVGRFRPFSRYEMDGDANARLIAAAPELLDALKRAYNDIHINCIDEEWCTNLCKRMATAISKAEGK